MWGCIGVVVGVCGGLFYALTLQQQSEQDRLFAVDNRAQRGCLPPRASLRELERISVRRLLMGLEPSCEAPALSRAVADRK